MCRASSCRGSISAHAGSSVPAPASPARVIGIAKPNAIPRTAESVLASSRARWTRSTACLRTAGGSLSASAMTSFSWSTIRRWPASMTTMLMCLRPTSTYGAGQYVAVGDNGCVLLSADGAAWLSVAQSATAERLNNVIFAAGQYVAVGEGGAIITSPDGRTWTARSSGLTGWLRGLTYVGPLSYVYGYFTNQSTGTMPARFIASGQGGSIISSLDGIK